VNESLDIESAQDFLSERLDILRSDHYRELQAKQSDRQLTFQLDQLLLLCPLCLSRDIRVPVSDLSVRIAHLEVLPIQSHLSR
jgi:hypothetical protein